MYWTVIYKKNLSHFTPNRPGDYSRTLLCFFGILSCKMGIQCLIE